MTWLRKRNICKRFLPFCWPTLSFRRKLESLFYLQLVYTLKHTGGSLFARSRESSTHIYPNKNSPTNTRLWLQKIPLSLPWTVVLFINFADDSNTTGSIQLNTSFLTHLVPLFQNESPSKTFVMKVCCSYSVSEIKFGVKWIAFVSRWCYNSGPLNVIGLFIHDGIGVLQTTYPWRERKQKTDI